MIRIAALFILVFASDAFAGWRPLGPYGGVITSMAVSKDGIYAGTEGGGVFYSSDGGRNWEGRGKGLQNIFVESLAVSKERTLYAGTRDGVFKSGDGKSWDLLSSVPRDAAVKNITFDAGENLYAALWGSGIYICKKDSVCVNSRDELSSPYVHTILVEDNGDIIAATEGGVFVKPKGEEKWQLGGLQEYMIVPALAFDSRGTLYAGTWGSGVHYFEKDDWHFRSMGVGSSMLAVLAKGPDGNLYAGTEGGVSVLSPGAEIWSAIGPENIYVKTLGFGNKGEVYAGSYGRGFWVRERGKEWDARNKGIYNTNILSVAVSDQGEIFAGTKQGLYINVKGDDGWEEVPDLYGMKVYSVLVDGKRVYAATSNGLFVGSASAKGWRRAEGDIGFMPVTALTRDASFIYAGTDTDGIYRTSLIKEEWGQVNDGLGNMRIRNLLTDQGGTVYAGTYGGVYALPKGKAMWDAAGLQGSVVVSLTAGGGTIFAGVENKGVYAMKDGKWLTLDGALPNKRVLSLAHSGKALFASGYGWVIYRDGDGPWKEVTGELSNTVIQALTTDKAGKVYAGTWGSGIWRMD